MTFVPENLTQRVTIVVRASQLGSVASCTK
jgi:hypothetical protein